MQTLSLSLSDVLWSDLQQESQKYDMTVQEYVVHMIDGTFFTDADNIAYEKAMSELNKAWSRWDIYS